MKILVAGSSGQVGWELCRSLQACGQVVAINRADADFSDFAAVRGLLDAHRPDVIINAAAYTAVDAAEDNEAEALQLNGELPGLLARWCARNNSLLVHYSTDYVFDGSGERPWQESDTAAPVSAYGRTKLAGELAVAESGCDYLVFRTAWVYAARGKNFLLTMLRLAAERAELNVVADQFGTPTPARFIADVTAAVLPQVTAERDSQSFGSGIFHLVAGGYTHWAGFAEEIVAAARERGMPVQAELVNGIATEDYPTPARRPANSRLSTDALQARFGVHIPPWQGLVRLCVAECAAS